MPITDEDFERLRRAVFGNGHVGLDEQVRNHTTAIREARDEMSLIRGDIQALSRKIDNRLDEMRKSIDQLERARRDEEMRKDGSLKTLNAIKWALSVLVALVTIGGTLGMLKLSADWNQVQQQIQRIPSLPE